MLCDVGVGNETTIQVTVSLDVGYNPGEYDELDDTRKQVRIQITVPVLSKHLWEI